MTLNRSAWMLTLVGIAGCTTPAAQPTPPAAPAMPAPGPRATDNGSTYRRMLDAALANPAAADWPALRQAYAASPAYDPMASLRPPAPGHPSATQALKHGDWQTACAIAEAAVNANVMDLRALVNAALAERRLGREDDAKRHFFLAGAQVHAIFSTGDGLTPQTAYHVLSTSEEYVVLDELNIRPGQQALVRLNGHLYDKLSGTHLPDGKPVEIWYNVDLSFAGEMAMMRGQLHPVPQDQLPRG